MATDLSRGLGDDREFVFAEQPDDPEMRESVNAWIWNEAGGFGMPRIGIEAVADQWDTHDIQVNMGYEDGRVFQMFEPGKVHDPLGADGKPRILGAGPVSFELIEPFKRWKLRIEGGMAHETTVQNQMEAKPRPQGEGTIPVDIEVDIEHVVPLWENGALLESARRILETQEEGDLMGNPRFEQLFRAKGTVRIGDDTHELDGGGLRIRRQGIRRMAGFWGHAWQSSVFPSGRAFGYIVYPPREDGKETYNEGYIFEGDGDLIGARVADAPWLRRLVPHGEDVSVVLEPEKGDTVTIAGTSQVSTYSVMRFDENSTFPILQQAIARFTWDGESASGMMERSTPSNKMEL